LIALHFKRLLAAKSPGAGLDPAPGWLHGMISLGNRSNDLRNQYVVILLAIGIAGFGWP
jgi:hypothetical protein